MLKLGLPILLLGFGLFALQGMSLFSQSSPKADGRQFSQQVNLAMRQAADRLLDLAGDSTHAIPPVEEVSGSEYLLRLENNFSYDSLPAYLEEALAQFGIQEKYYVSVHDCITDFLTLGYASETFKAGDTPCSGRAHPVGCYNLSVVFPERAKKTGGNGLAWAGLVALVVAAMAIGYAVKPLKNNKLEVAEQTPQTTGAAAFIQIGNTQFDPANQFVQIGELRQPITFREAKLLHFFVQHQNQVLERDAILAAVWEDEGIIVGRSLDVFVSRLRKILQKDPALRIANVHGVGYRLEVASEPQRA